MRFESVTAHTFGPFSGRTLLFSEGMTVVHGPNEAGKSTWHAALFAGLCGMRRGQGAMRKEDREFAERHRPWDGGAWEVSAVIRLGDGRRIELRHDLSGRVDCRASDATLGRDCSAEIMHDGAPDGSRWIGLDRRSFLATACVRQGELLGVLHDARLLQEHLQRAAATAGTDSTAAAALERLERYQREHVGLDRANSSRPLRNAMNNVQAREQAYVQANREHREYLELAATVEELRAVAAHEQRSVQLVQAKCAALDAEASERRRARALELSARFPAGPPPGLTKDDQLAQDVATALRAWDDRPEEPSQSGPTAAELQQDLEALPGLPAGDLQPAANVLALYQAFRDAKVALERHEADRPSEPVVPPTGSPPEQDLRDLARDLAEAPSELQVAPKERVERARHRVNAAPHATPGRVTIGAGGVMIAAGLTGAVLGYFALGLVLLVGGAALLGWTLYRASAARVEALEELRQAEDALGEDRHAAERYSLARQRVGALRLPADPGALERLAQQVAAAAQGERDLGRWQARHQDLVGEYNRSGEKPVVALHDRGVMVAGSLLRAFADYGRACADRAALSAMTARRPELERRLADRRGAEDAANKSLERRVRAQCQLGEVARRCNLSSADDDTMAKRLRDWQRQRREELGKQDVTVRAWAELESLLDGRSVDHLTDDARRRRDLANQLAVGLNPAGLASVTLEGDVEAQANQLRAAAEAAVRSFEQARGQVEERARGLLSVPEAEEALAAAYAELRRVRQLDQTLTRTQEFLKNAEQNVHRTIAPKLADSVRRWLPRVTDGRYLDVRVDPQTLDVRVAGAEGRWRNAALLSHGTAEQVYLLLRMAMAEHLTKPGEACPLVLDDVTAQSDTRRKEAVLRALHAISQVQQVVLFSQESEVLAWAREHLRVPRDRLEQLDPSVVVA